MDKKIMIDFLNCQAKMCKQWGECDTCPGGQLCREAEKEIRRLILSDKRKKKE